MLGDVDINSYEEYVQSLMNESQVPGVAVGFSKNGQIIYEKGFGYRDVENQLEATVDTVFCIGSVTKSFTCVAIMQLQEADKLSVHDPVTKYLPEFRLKNSNAAKEMTIHHFMTHTSGMPALPYLTNSMYSAINEDLSEDQIIQRFITNEKEPVSYEEYMETIAQRDIELLGPPGRQFSYSNDCYSLLGAIVERVSGKKYEVYVKEHILEPAGMKHSGFFHDDLEGYENFTIPYVMRNNNGIRDVIASPKWWDAPAMRAAGLLNSTVRDILRYTEIFLTGGVAGEEQILTGDSVKQMIRPYIATNMVPGQYYGYGLMVTPDFHGSTLIEHSGAGKGVAAMMKMIPDEGLAGVGLSNLYMAPISAIINGAMNIFGKRPLEYSDLDKTDHHVSTERLSEYVGNYQSGEKGTVPIKLEGGKLTLTSLEGSYILEGLNVDLFKIKIGGTYESVRFIRNKENHVCKMSFRGRILVKV